MEKVRVYWNLHKDVWSVRSCKSGLVIDHKPHMTIRDGYFSVWKSGQKRVREEGKKNVLAFAVGYIIDDKNPDILANFLQLIDDSIDDSISWNRVKYNPHTDDFFMHQSMSDNQWKPNEWNEIPRDWVGWIRMETLENNHGRYPRVYI